MKNILLYFLLFLFEVKCSYAQNTLIDSLKKELHLASNDTSRSDLYFKMCIYYQEDQTDSALFFSRQDEIVTLQSHDNFRLARVWQERGVCFDFANKLDSCLNYLKKADSLYTIVNRLDKKAATLCDIGMAYYFRGNYELGLRNYLKSYDLMKRYSARKDVAKILNNIGLVYRVRKDYKNAVKYYQSSLAIKREINDEKGIMNTIINIGSAFQRQDIYDSAYYYAREAREIAEKLQLKKDILICTTNMGAALASMGRTNEALDILLKSEKEVIENKYLNVLPTVYESLGTIYIRQNKFPLALDYYFKALDNAKATNSLEPMAVFYKEIASAFAKKGDYRNAYVYLDTTKKLYDSLMNIENSRQINEMSAVYESSEKENEIQKLNTSNIINTASLKARKNERNYFILSTLLFIGLTGLAYNAYKGNRKKRNQLDAQNKIIETSLREKEVLLREIHHRVKNNLQIVSSLLSLQSNYISDEKALDAVRESKSRVQSMAIIHQNLYQDESLVNIDVKEYVEILTTSIFHSYNIHDENIKLEMDIQPLRLDVDTMVPLGLVLNELINNCLKYAFPSHKNGKIKVILKQDSSSLKLSVYDNGIGLNGKESHFDQNSFGHKMINAFMKKLKGDIKIYSEDGTRVDIEIKNFKEATT